MSIEWAVCIIILCIIFRDLIVMAAVAIGGFVFLVITVAFILLCETWDKIKDWRLNK